MKRWLVAFTVFSPLLLTMLPSYDKERKRTSTQMPAPTATTTAVTKRGTVTEALGQWQSI